MNKRTDLGNSALLTAVETNNLALVKMLVNAGAEIDTKDSFGDTPLGRAAECGYTNMHAYLKTKLTDSLENKVSDSWPDGIRIESGFVSAAQEKELVTWLDQQSWTKSRTGSDARDTQQYGFEFNYVSPDTNPEPTRPIPKLIQETVIDRLVCFDRTPDQVIVNRYPPGGGIRAHIDHVVHFGPTICTVSLMANCELTLTPKDGSSKPVVVPLPRRSVVYLSGDARYKWSHSIVRGALHSRISITCRTMSDAFNGTVVKNV